MSVAFSKLCQILSVWCVTLLVVALVWPNAIFVSQLWFLVLMSIFANLLQPAYRLPEGSRNSVDRGTARQIVWTVYGSQILAILELGVRGRETIEWDWLSISAAMIMVGGLILRSWAVLCLGRFFTWNIELTLGQSVIKSGPYRFIRHPSYTGAWLTYVASCILLRSWVSAIVTVVLLSLAFKRRVQYEEMLLKDNVNGYKEYCREVGKFFPRPRPICGIRSDD